MKVLQFLHGKIRNIAPESTVLESGIAYFMDDEHYWWRTHYDGVLVFDAKRRQVFFGFRLYQNIVLYPLEKQSKVVLI